ncbi:hypothetical protein GBF35_01530 [Nonomuraea phyllanthi]|uniref:hypothetical protein n=1 Tax=Nonomuraea phyllanthi TaxID=2219224 RepID=UPI0012931A2F|nr:hypothetical protein [Nonomuraea phyllanthi]QFY05536.1 hypothetical protein GBF35_01530 [Nonomuraea phyllanthi]
MGRHRSDPMGAARLTVAVLAAGAVVTLLVIGARALVGSLGAAAERDRTSAATAAPATEIATEVATQATVRVPTVRIECVAETCPIVTVRVPGGDVLQYREMSRGEEVSYYEPELEVVLSDAGTVRVTANGEARPRGEAGEREAFTVKSPD